MPERTSGAPPTVAVGFNEQQINQTNADTIVVMAPSADGTNWTDALHALDQQLDGHLRQALIDAQFSGNIAASFKMPTFGRLPAKRIVVAGLPAENNSRDAVRRAYGAAARFARNAGAEQVICLAGSGGLQPLDAWRAATEGVLLGLYTFQRYRTNDKKSHDLESWDFLHSPDDDANEGIRQGHAVAAGIYLARDLIFEPGNTIYPESLAAVAVEMARTAELEVEVFDEQQLAEMGAGAIVAVGRGSEHLPRLVHLTYRPSGESQGTIALVGKGITFDTGGMSLKTGSGMVPMKTDMAGSAAVIGAMRAIAELDLPFTVYGIVAAAENMPSDTAYRPSDVLTALNGKTIEVISTDAEGRLVLADALVYAARQGAEEMIDLATLTGAKVVALGEQSVAVYSNDDAMAQAVVEAGNEAGEQFWHMPLWKSLRKQLNSETADLKNTGGRPGGSITAALFLSEFTEGVPWTHLDIAGAAWTSSNSGYTPEGATGVGTRALINYLERKAGRLD